MDIEELKARFKAFAINVASLLQDVPPTMTNKAYSSQLIRSSSSSAANYRAACRAKSRPDFINKLKIVEEELDESLFFLELLDHFNPNLRVPNERLQKEGHELLAITVSSIKTSRANA
jgi:four helix bundle protein